ncbi:MAG: hypothetical protein ACT4OZ_10310 [Gemmatimonadota bacterium]
MNEDYRDFLTALLSRNARFLVVGAHALAVRIETPVEGVLVPVLGLADLRRNKLSTGRDRDRADLKGLDGKS